MGEFTTGVLYPRKYEPKVIHSLPKSRQPYFHKNVNSTWNAFFLQDEWIGGADTMQFLLRLSSQHVPLLWFHDAEDKGWGYRLFDGGYEVSSAAINYELDVEMAESIMSSRYPDIELAEEVIENEELRKEYEQVLDQVARSSGYRQEVWKGVSRVRPESFATLLSHKQIFQLRSLFNLHFLAGYDEETGNSYLYDSVDLFKEILGIEEMMWVNYTYLASGGRE
ncbi:hypothetical protein ACI7RC_18115 [Brevibacillus sp. B_LB10_24]|uniref:hypothetical protein n=1 Tax=Brevibacillus sp. B_LB10_24 TaxID=3380645 RepID=UPI0038BC591D